MVDLNKEIKLSDLFRRGKGPADPGAEKPPKPAREPRPKRSFRRERGPQTAAVAPRVAPELPQIPLMRAFDLLPKEGQEGEGGSPLPRILVALAAVLVVAGLAAFFLFSSASLADQQSRHDELRGELAALELPAEEPGGASQPALLAEQRSRTSALAGALATRVAWDRLLREISLVLPEEVTLTSLVATVPAAPAPGAVADPNAAPTTGVTIGGFTDDQGGVALLLARLSVLPELSSVQLVSANAVETEDGTSSGGELIQFTIAAGIRTGTS